MSEEAVDVVAVIRKASQTAELRHDDAQTAWALWDASAIVAELIAADREYDAAVKLAGRVITNDVQRKVSDALARRAAALQRITGDNNGH